MKELKIIIESLINEEKINKDIIKVYKRTSEEYQQYLSKSNEKYDKYDQDKFDLKITKRKRK